MVGGNVVLWSPQLSAFLITGKILTLCYIPDAGLLYGAMIGVVFFELEALQYARSVAQPA